MLELKIVNAVEYELKNKELNTPLSIANEITKELLDKELHFFDKTPRGYKMRLPEGENRQTIKEKCKKYMLHDYRIKSYSINSFSVEIEYTNGERNYLLEFEE